MTIDFYVHVGPAVSVYDLFLVSKSCFIVLFKVFFNDIALLFQVFKMSMWADEEDRHASEDNRLLRSELEEESDNDIQSSKEELGYNLSSGDSVLVYVDDR